MPLDTLLERFFTQELDPELDSINYGTHNREEDLIQELASLSFSPVRHAGARVTGETKKLHKSPNIDFTIPNGENVRKEIGDILFDVEALTPGREDRRRVFISQAKFDEDRRTWDVDQEQFFYIHNLPSSCFPRRLPASLSTSKKSMRRTGITTIPTERSRQDCLPVRANRFSFERSE